MNESMSSNKICVVGQEENGDLDQSLKNMMVFWILKCSSYNTFHLFSKCKFSHFQKKTILKIYFFIFIIKLLPTFMDGMYYVTRNCKTHNLYSHWPYAFENSRTTGGDIRWNLICPALKYYTIWKGITSKYKWKSALNLQIPYSLVGNSLMFGVQSARVACSTGFCTVSVRAGSAFCIHGVPFSFYHFMRNYAILKLDRTRR